MVLIYAFGEYCLWCLILCLTLLGLVHVISDPKDVTYRYIREKMI